MKSKLISFVFSVQIGFVSCFESSSRHVKQRQPTTFQTLSVFPDAVINVAPINDQQILVSVSRTAPSFARTSSIITSSSVAVDGVFGRTIKYDEDVRPLKGRNVNDEGNSIDNFYGGGGISQWGDEVRDKGSIATLAGTDLKEYNAERKMLNMMPVVGIIWGAAFFAMNWLNYELNDQTYMSEEEEAKINTVQIPLIAGLIGLSYIVALWTS